MIEITAFGLGIELMSTLHVRSSHGDRKAWTPVSMCGPGYKERLSNPCGFHHHAVLHPARGQACWYPEEDRLAQFRHTIPRDSGPTTTRLAVISSASHLENASCWMLRYLNSQAGSIQKTAGKIRALGQLSSRLAATLRDGYWSARLPFGRVAELPLKGGGDFFDAEMLVHCLHR